MKKEVYLFQPQNEIVVGGVSNYWIPYSAGCIWSYAQQFEDIRNNFSLEHIFFKRDSVSDVLSRIKNPSVIGFSCYIWNQNYCLGISKIIKERFPDCIIVFGGPQVSGRFLQYEFIDSLVMAEGEESFLDILTSLLINKKPEQIYSKKRLENLDIPSPYTTEVFDTIIAENPDVYWATTIETNRGCPFACTFCDWGGVTYSKIKKFSLERIVNELKWISANKISYLFAADANFGIFKERDLEIARLMRTAADIGHIDAINLQYAKNSTEEVFEIANIIGPYNRGITVSVQSMNPDTLVAIKRSNLEINDISNIMKISQEKEIPTYTEVILGLPLETIESWKTGLCELLELGQHQSIDLNFTEILENSELASFESRKKYGLKTIKAESFYSLCKDEFPELGEVVVSTNTMNTEQMIECYLYAWMIIHFHIYGYTQLIAKYARNIHNVSYRQFYDELFDQIKKSDGVINDHYKELESSIRSYLTTGKLKLNQNANVRGDIIHFASHEFFYKNKIRCIDLGSKVLKNYVDNTGDILHLQDLFLYDDQQKLPIKVESNINIKTWGKTQTTYLISNVILEQMRHNTNKKAAVNNKKKVDFWALRRKNLLKNHFSIDSLPALSN